MFLMIETFVQYGIYLARVVLTSFLLCGLFTVSKHVLFLYENTKKKYLVETTVLLFGFGCQKNIIYLFFFSTEKTKIFTHVRYHDDFCLHLLFSDV